MELGDLKELFYKIALDQSVSLLDQLKSKLVVPAPWNPILQLSLP